MRPDRLRPVTPLTARDRALLDRLAEHEPLTTSELRLLFFTGERTCRQRLAQLERAELLLRVYPAAGRRGTGEALWFLTAKARLLLAAPARRTPSLSLPDLEHRRAVARLLLHARRTQPPVSGRGAVVLARRSPGRARHRWSHPSGRIRPLPPSERRGDLLPRARPLDRAREACRREARRLHTRARDRRRPRARQHPPRSARANGGSETSPRTPQRDRPGSGAPPTASASSSSPRSLSSASLTSCRRGPAIPVTL